MRAAAAVLAAALAACGSGSPPGEPASTDLATCVPPGSTAYLEGLPPRLSNLCLMVPGGGQVQPKAGVVAYDLNTPLFSDYALKSRMIWVPPGTRLAYDDTAALDLPVGSVVAKTFAMAPDLRQPAVDARLVETRVLVRTRAGWQGASYLWSADQMDAELLPGGLVRDIAFIDPGGRAQVAHYLVPSVNQCSRCHDSVSDGQNHLLGPTVRNLNRAHDYGAGPVNQLTHLGSLGLLQGGWPAPDAAPRLAAWDDAGESLDHRARAWLEVNCAHCHNPRGLARPYGLDLFASVTDPVAIGVCKDPVAAGAGAGGRKFDIVPGNPGASILTYRLEATAPAVAMPQVGRSVPHAESLQLITDWIQQMPLPAGLACH